jgi:hypothetical protein
MITLHQSKYALREWSSFLKNEEKSFFVETKSRKREKWCQLFWSTCHFMKQPKNQ